MTEAHGARRVLEMRESLALGIVDDLLKPCCPFHRVVLHVPLLLYQVELSTVGILYVAVHTGELLHEMVGGAEVVTRVTLNDVQQMDDKIYEFLTDDINYYTQKFELMVTDNFKTKQIRTPKMSGIGVKIENDLLQIDLKNIDIDAKEIKDIMEKYSLKKKYHRLKDGSFIDLENSKEIDFLDKLVTRNGY